VFRLTSGRGDARGARANIRDYAALFGRLVQPPDGRSLRRRRRRSELSVGSTNLDARPRQTRNSHLGFDTALRGNQDVLKYIFCARRCRWPTSWSSIIKGYVIRHLSYELMLRKTRSDILTHSQTAAAAAVDSVGVRFSHMGERPAVRLRMLLTCSYETESNGGGRDRWLITQTSSPAMNPDA
jgi:hypothetical protein